MRIFAMCLFCLCVILFGPSVSLGIGLTEESRDLLVRAERFAEVEDLISAGDCLQARVAVDALLERYLGHDDAEFLQVKLAKECNRPGEADTTDVVSDADKIWRDAKAAIKKRRYREARRMLLEVKNRFASTDVVPAFLSQLGEQLLYLDKEVMKSLEPDLRLVKADLARSESDEFSVELISNLSKDYKLLMQMLAENPALDDLVRLIDHTLDFLDKLSRILFAKAKAVRDLDGCRTALPMFREILSVLRADELKYYKRAKKELDVCEGM